ncbi:hypothetical protein Lesp02_51470 [Lentzea sp. NBRC 105346]|uniref:hypothetical protein n=1 Tax=Lentzea sp. NBRC 105346 TaxID=3032205 RepID=UPI0024A4205B|nr:hypothetical protein [Lentzea sp. NBRC 105346]GLZ32959.1 hypothetical protein Lesp02_51470 [Lentzea sp. NBRC 105346]
MRHVWIAAVAAAVVLAGCTSGNGGNTSPTSSANDAAAVQYMDKVCAAASEFAKLEKSAPKLDSGDPAKLKADMAAYMGQLSAAFTKSAEELRKVGPSPIAGGEAAVNKMADAFTTLAATFTEAKTKIEQADANDASGGLQAAGEAIAKLSQLADPLKDLEAVPELEKAATSAPKCQEMRNLGVAPTSN